MLPSLLPHFGETQTLDLHVLDEGTRAFEHGLFLFLGPVVVLGLDTKLRVKLGVLLFQALQRVHTLVPIETPHEHRRLFARIARVQANRSSELLDGGQIVLAGFRFVHAIARDQIDRLVEDTDVADDLDFGVFCGGGVAERVDDGLAFGLGNVAMNRERVDHNPVVRLEHLLHHAFELEGFFDRGEVLHASTFSFLQHPGGEEQRLVAQQSVCGVSKLFWQFIAFHVG